MHDVSVSQGQLQGTSASARLVPSLGARVVTSLPINPQICLGRPTGQAGPSLDLGDPPWNFPRPPQLSLCLSLDYTPHRVQDTNDMRSMITCEHLIYSTGLEKVLI